MDTTLNTANIYLDSNSLAGLKRQAETQSDDALKAVAQQFEALFVQQMLKSMRDAELGQGIFDNDQSRLYTDLYDKQLSLTLTSQKGVGLADMLFQQLKLSQANPISKSGES